MSPSLSHTLSFYRAFTKSVPLYIAGVVSTKTMSGLKDQKLSKLFIYYTVFVKHLPHSRLQWVEISGNKTPIASAAWMIRKVRVWICQIAKMTSFTYLIVNGDCKSPCTSVHMISWWQKQICCFAWTNIIILFWSEALMSREIAPFRANGYAVILIFAVKALLFRMLC